MVFQVQSRSFITTTTYNEKEIPQQDIFVELVRGDRLRFTDWLVTFPTGAQGYEFKLVKTQIRTSTAFENETPPVETLCYLLIEEATDHLDTIE
jgi:hypothetical protein